MENGADRNCQNASQETPLHQAVKLKKLEIIKLLIETSNKEASLKVMADNQEFTPFMRACESNNRKIVQYLLDNNLVLPTNQTEQDENAIRNYRNQNNETALHLAAKNSANDVVLFLVEQGFDLYARDINGITPYDYIRASRFTRLPLITALQNSFAMQIPGGSMSFFTRLRYYSIALLSIPYHLSEIFPHRISIGQGMPNYNLMNRPEIYRETSFGDRYPQKIEKLNDIGNIIFRVSVILLGIVLFLMSFDVLPVFFTTLTLVLLTAILALLVADVFLTITFNIKQKYFDMLFNSLYCLFEKTRVFLRSLTNSDVYIMEEGVELLPLEETGLSNNDDVDDESLKIDNIGKHLRNRNNDKIKDEYYDEENSDEGKLTRSIQVN